MRTSQMFVLLGAALLTLTTARCRCGGSEELDCSNVGDERCYSGNPQWYPHGAVFQTCNKNSFDSTGQSKLWEPEWCLFSGDGGSSANCSSSGLICWDGYCYCPPVH